MSKIYYQNKKGNPVSVGVTDHAIARFIERYNLLFGTALDVDAAIEKIAHLFKHANRLTKLGKHYRQRLERHGRDTLFFRKNEFTFVIQDAHLVSVEISAKNHRHLNKKKGQ